MRIRRRLPLPSSSSSSSSPPRPPPPPAPLQNADLSLFQLQPPRKGEAAKEKGVEVGGRGEGLHPDGDLPIEPHGRVMDPINRDPPPSGLHPTTGRSKQGSNPSFFPPSHPTLTHDQVVKEVKEEEEMEDSDKRWNGQVNSNKRLGSSSSALVSVAAAPAGRAFLAKKRREGGHDDNGNGDGRSEEKPVGKEKTAKAKAKAKASSARVENNCTSVHGGDNQGGDAVVANGSVGSGGKKRRSPAVLMEGSRCSRVNGRGWRCCQQTLVGYSLCEHHLGKGRLRSMSSVRVQAGGNKSKKSTREGLAEGELPSVSSPQEEEEEEKARDKQCLGVDNGGEDIEDEKQQARKKKKKKKIGMVKARTISSLLDVTNHSVQPTLSPSSSSSPPPPPPPLEPASMQEGETIV